MFEIGDKVRVKDGIGPEQYTFTHAGSEGIIEAINPLSILLLIRFTKYTCPGRKPALGNTYWLQPNHLDLIEAKEVIHARDTGEPEWQTILKQEVRRLKGGG